MTEPAWFRGVIRDLDRLSHRSDRREWQSQDVSSSPDMVTIERTHQIIELNVPQTMESLQRAYDPSLPWAEDHFQERVSGIPHNPPPSEAWWPFAVKGNEAHKHGELFSHTYPERMWPKLAGMPGTKRKEDFPPGYSQMGIRYYFGDLDDLVNMLMKNCMTRQAYLPIWFPEDTGAIDGQRVPCTLGYHFLVTGVTMDITYFMRSCDAIRHLRDDAYMAARLLQWIVGKLEEHGIHCNAGKLVMHVSSLHMFVGDEFLVGNWIKQWNEEEDDDYPTGAV